MSLLTASLVVALFVACAVTTTESGEMFAVHSLAGTDEIFEACFGRAHFVSSESRGLLHITDSAEEAEVVA